MEFMNRQEVFDHAVKHVEQQIVGNQELFIAQVIKMNPTIDFTEYKVCHGYLSYSGVNEFWLEKLK